MLTRVIKSVRRRLALRMKRTYKIGRYFIRLPPRHLLDVYQESFKNYDKKLPVLAALLEGKYKSSMTIIDIGANIGDSAIALRNACNSPIICAEGNPEFLPILKSNLAAIPGIFRVIEKFIGPGHSSQVVKVITENGTAHVDRAATHEIEKQPKNDHLAVTGMISYKEIIEANVDLPLVRLVKIDTDGFDFQIILGAINQLASSMPVLFFEFDPSFSPKDAAQEALVAANALISAGYVHFVTYDNFGNYMLSFSDKPIERFKDLFAFLEQSRNSGGGTSYLDICGFSEHDCDVFFELVESERSESKSVVISR